ncbi:MAG TPA: dipeptide epimerase [Vicinamibacteria bacterium]|nr:dipeptide epimerase [Vicinamibacteria bacterium]
MPLLIRSRPLDLRLRHTFRIARGASDVRENLLVELEHAGEVGLGEAAPIRRYGEDRASATAAVEAMAGRLAEPRAFSVAARAAAVPGQRSAEAAVDMALHDVAGRRMGVPLYELLGLDRSRAPETSFTIGMDAPEVVARKVKEAASYPILKVKMGSADDREVLTAVRDSTDRPVRVDANEGWTPAEAVERLSWLARMGVEFVEQPLPADQIDETRALRRQSPLPFYADESVHRAEDIPRLAGAFDGINIKLMKCGGLAEALRMIAVARAHGLKVMLGCMIESSIAITAAAHISPLVDTADLDGNLLLDEDPYAGATVAGGRLVLPDAPGLGVRPRSSRDATVR